MFEGVIENYSAKLVPQYRDDSRRYVQKFDQLEGRPDYFLVRGAKTTDVSQKIVYQSKKLILFL